MSRVLKLARLFHGLTQTDVANALGIAKSSVSAIESGKRPLSLPTIRRYAKLFIPPSSLLLFMEEFEGEYVPAEHGYLRSNALKLMEWLRERAQLPDDEQGAEHGADGAEEAQVQVSDDS
jgi:transcriptional regulator with XRE-family HTH domain